jgi:thiamine biosynthesis lipoprotein
VSATRHDEPVMGTVVTIDVRNCSETASEAAIGQALDWLHWVDRTFSTYLPGSEICRIERGELHIDDAQPHVRNILAACDELGAMTQGYFDAFATGRLDPSGLVKGWSLEQASDILVAAGCPDHLISGGGDIQLRGRTGSDEAWRVAVVHPFRLDGYCAVLELDGGAVATSGTYERGFHVIDPHLGRPAMDLASVTVIGEHLATTDAYATAALAMGDLAPEWLEGLVGFEGMVIDADGRGHETSGFDRYRVALAVS